MAETTNTPSSEDIQDLNIEDLFAPLPEKTRLGGPGPFVINLSASSAPIDVPAKGVAGCSHAHVYQVHRIEDRRPRYRLRLGPFAREDDADTELLKVRDIYPSALTATADADDLRIIAALQVKAPASPSPTAKPAVPTLVEAVAKQVETPVAPIPVKAVTKQVEAPMELTLVEEVAKQAETPVAPIPVKAVTKQVEAPMELTLVEEVTRQVETPVVRPSVAAVVKQVETQAVRPSVAAVAKPVEKPVMQAAAMLAEKPAAKVVAPMSATHKPAAAKQVSPAMVTAVAPAALTPQQKLPVRAPVPLQAERPSQRAISLESTQTIRALTQLELEDDQASRWFAIQLSLAEEPFDPETLPNLDIFSVYRLYSVAGIDNGRIVHALRLGFFTEQIAASAVASYLAAYYDNPAIKRVSAAERERFAAQSLQARKDVGAAGKQAEIEITNERYIREKRIGQAAGK
jgi:hypothetical protein